MQFLTNLNKCLFFQSFVIVYNWMDPKIRKRKRKVFFEKSRNIFDQKSWHSNHLYSVAIHMTFFYQVLIYHHLSKIVSMVYMFMNVWMVGWLLNPCSTSLFHFYIFKTNFFYFQLYSSRKDEKIYIDSFQI